MASHARVTIELYHGTAKPPRTTAVTYCVRRPNTHGPVTRRARCRARSEWVQRDRVGKIGLGHAWVANESRSILKPGAWFTCSVLEPNSETGDGAFRDLGRGGMLYILRAGRMTASSTRPHRTSSDSTRIQIRPSGKCDSKQLVH